ncbi:LysR family transcriptional regulator [Lactobacillus sp. ESL0791]|uniref:LysR family transcriptional regulator n=1 Tax=Lactobacillus sp. ESL0791 TaxID=2983234 RepID=UPI0023F8A4AF|nr:LysR family transcriptional regulator [Lactobacillus sp. ESL0791]MDF7637888.1 LysR family transcriptional regulator [Lactobacillus sp. ESL0791]
MNNPEVVLHYIDVLLKENNFTKAAHELYISQPYLTQLIKRIEKKLGTQIISRKQVPFSLTSAGVIYYKYLEKAITDQQCLLQNLLPYVHPDNDIIKIGILESLGTFLLPELLPNFIKENPNTKIQLIENVPRSSESQLLNEQIDCYIGQTPEALTKGIKFYVNGGERYFIIISPKSKYFQKGKFILKPNEYNLKEILQAPFVASAPGSAIRHQLNGIFQKFHVKPNIITESKSVITVTNLAIHGLGLTISAASIIKRMAPTPINLLPIDPKFIRIKYFIATKDARKISPTLAKLITDFCKLQLEPDIK